MSKKYKGKHYKKGLIPNVKINIKTPQWVYKTREVFANALDYVDDFIEKLIEEIKETFLEIKMKIGEWYEECR